MDIKTNLLNNEILRLVNNVYFNEIFTPDVDRYTVKVDNLEKATALIDSDFLEAQDFDPEGTNTLKPVNNKVHINYITEEKRKSYKVTVKTFELNKIVSDVDVTEFVNKQLSLLYASYARDLFRQYLQILDTYNEKDEKIGIKKKNGDYLIDVNDWNKIENKFLYNLEKNVINTKEDIIIFVFNELYNLCFSGNEFAIGGGPENSNTLFRRTADVLKPYEFQIIPNAQDEPLTNKKALALFINKKAIKLFIETPIVRQQENAEGNFINYYMHTHHKWFVNKHTYPYVYLVNEGK